MQRVEIIIQVFNDTDSPYILLDKINKLESNSYIFSVAIVDDFSSKPVGEEIEITNYDLIKHISIVRLAKIVRPSCYCNRIKKVSKTNQTSFL